jgi:hypothetical protein
MPSLNSGDLEDCLLQKLGAAEVAGGRHRKFRVYDNNGNLVGDTLMSRSWRRSTTIDASMVSSIRKQLNLPQVGDLVDLVGCTLSREDYLKLCS